MTNESCYARQLGAENSTHEQMNHVAHENPHVRGKAMGWLPLEAP